MDGLMHIRLEPRQGWGRFERRRELGDAIADVFMPLVGTRWHYAGFGNPGTFEAEATRELCWFFCDLGDVGGPCDFDAIIPEEDHEEVRFFVTWLEALMRRFDLVARLAWEGPAGGRGLTSSRRHCARSARRWARGQEPHHGEQGCEACAAFVPSTGAFPQDWGACCGDSPLCGAAVSPRHMCSGFEEGPGPTLDSMHQRLLAVSSYESEPRIAPELQCGGCRYYVPLDAPLLDDWGLCSHPASSRDGQAVFEHEGCVAFTHNTLGWGGATPRRSLERGCSSEE